MTEIERILEDLNFRRIESDESESENEYSLSESLLKDLKGNDKRYTARTIHWKNEWHDEKLTQIQLLIADRKIGLGTVIKISEEILSVYYGEKTELRIKGEYIPSVVPGLELLHQGRNIIGGGFIRNNLMEKTGNAVLQAVMITLIKERL